jgi:Gpi18-like mannosyltransferase
MTASNSAEAGPMTEQRRTISAPVRLVAIGIVALYLHALLWQLRPPDMASWQEPWLAHIVHYGAIGAFAHPFSNYTPAYLYLLAVASLADGLIAPMSIVKTLSVAGTLFMAFASADLLRAMGGRAAGAAVLLVLPSAIINAAYLGQCDALWVGACILAVSAMIGGRTLSSVVWCGVALAFKAQAAFIAPFIMGALWGRQVPWWQWLAPPVVFVGSMVPAWLAGWPAADLLMVYPLQAAHYDFPGKLANPWIAAQLFAPHTTQPWFVVGYAAALAAAGAIAVSASASVHNKRALLALAMLSALALPFFLPKMLERYYFLADVLGLVLAISFRTRLAVFIAVMIQLASILSHLSYMFWYERPFPTLIGALCAALALVATAYLAVREGAAWTPVGRRNLNSRPLNKSPART